MAQDLWDSRPPEAFRFQPSSAQTSTAPLAVRTVANTVTVKVLAGENRGSGTIVNRAGEVYVVITNAHVLTAGQGRPIRIQTMDGRTYSALLIPRSSTKPTDLALLEFRSSRSYQPATLHRGSEPQVGSPVYSAGYPFQTNQLTAWGFVVAVGQIALIPQRMFAGGYQVGYTSVVQKGMSGGPVLTADGHVVAINGMHAFPIWGDPYVYDDGTKPNLEQKAKMRELSWGIPSRRILSFLGLPELNGSLVKHQPEPPFLSR